MTKSTSYVNLEGFDDISNIRNQSVLGLRCSVHRIATLYSEQQWLQMSARLLLLGSFVTDCR